MIKGSAFLWHQVRCIMSILFLIGNKLEDIDLINEMLNEKSNKEFLYAIADDSNLVLTDCVFEFCNFETEEAVASNIFLRLEKIYQDNLMQTIINTHFFNIIFGANSIFTNVYNQSSHNIIDYINNNHRRKNKYTKMLQHKINREIQKPQKNDIRKK